MLKCLYGGCYEQSKGAYCPKHRAYQTALQKAQRDAKRFKVSEDFKT